MSEETTTKQSASTATEERPKPRSSDDDRGRGRGSDKDGSDAPRFKHKRRRKVSYLTLNKIDKVDYKDVNILKRFINDRGKILPSRQTGNTAKQQRMIATAVRRAREMALLPFTVTEISNERKEYGGRRSYTRDMSPRREGLEAKAAEVKAEAKTAEAKAPAAKAEEPKAEKKEAAPKATKAKEEAKSEE